MKTCATCNASQNNTVERVIRCGLCVAKQSGNTNWRPMGHNSQVSINAGMARRGMARRG